MKSYIDRYSDAVYNFNEAWFRYFSELKKLVGEKAHTHKVCPTCGNSIARTENGYKCECGWTVEWRMVHHSGGIEDYSMRGEVVGSIYMDAYSRKERFGTPPRIVQTEWEDEDGVTRAAYPVFGRGVSSSYYWIERGHKENPSLYEEYLNFILTTRPPEITGPLTFEEACDIARAASPINKARIVP